MDKDRKLRVGKDAVVYGDVSGDIGDGSVVIGPTDSRGNVILNRTMAVGRGAYAGPGSIAIGAGAGAGSDVVHAFHEIGKIIQSSGDTGLLNDFKDLCNELNKHEKDKSRIRMLWDTVKASGVLIEAIDSVSKVSLFIASIL
ncbi:MAG: hypothetical protein ABR911_09835 [Syntrophales bacterium]|jgi:hypothetical protein